MKKRTLISIVITIVCIALTNKFWFCIKPLQISFNAEGCGDTKFEFFLNKEDNNDFKKVKYGVIEANLDENNSVELFINRVHKAKRAKITVSAVSTPPPQLKNIILSEFELRYGKYKLDDLKAFSVEGAKLKIDGDRLIIYPESETVSLIYNKPVDLKSSTKFDIKVLIVITVLSFLLSYKLTSYLADFKTLNNASRMDIVFLFIFFILLFIPMSHIDTQSETSEKENRTLAKYEPFIKDKMINFDYGNDFEKWFNDRFYTRTAIVRLFFDVKYYLVKNYYERQGAYINKNNKWMFLQTKNKEDKFTLDDLKKYEYSIHKLVLFCRNNNIKLYILLAPDKEIVYTEEKYPCKLKNNEYENYLKIKKYIYEKENIKLINTYQIFRNNKSSSKDLFYFKTDHHWTDYGAYLGYQLIMNEIKKDYPMIYINREKDFNIFKNNKIRSEFGRYFFNGRTYVSMLNLHDQSVLNKNYLYYKHKRFNKLKIIEQNSDIKHKKDFFYKIYQYDIKAPRAVLFGDSFGDNLSEFFPYSFSKTLRIYTHSPILPYGESIKLKRFENKIIEFKPDILVVIFSRSGTGALNQFANKE